MDLADAPPESDDLHKRVEEAIAQAAELRSQVRSASSVLETRARARELRTQASLLRAERQQYRNMLEELKTMVENLRKALESRAGIEQAKGIVMAVRGSTPDEAFDALREISQRTNRKLVVVAAEVVDRAQKRGGAGVNGTATASAPAPAKHPAG